ncbi:calmodulin, putative, partial [Perkinsus marinus ATCC 50983]
AGFWSTDDEFADVNSLCYDTPGKVADSRLVSLLRRSAITELEVVEAFRSFDRDGRGKLDAADLVNAMTSMGNALLEDEAYQMIHQADPTAS